MADAQRLTVDVSVQHHAVTPEWKNKSKKEIAQWFSDNGFARAYGSNPANWSGLINPFTGQRSYSQTQSVGQMVDGSTPDATDAERAKGYRVFWIVQDPLGQICWHAGDWYTNRKSVGQENLGDYRNYAPSQGMKEATADFLRPLDRAVGGNFAVMLHNEIYATACPARIAEGRNDIVNLINQNPTPPVVTPPAPVTKPVPDAVALPTPLDFTTKLEPTNVWDLTTNPNYKASTTISKGKPFRAVAKIEFNGSVYYQTAYSFGKNKTGVNSVDLIPAVVPVVTTKEETKTESVAFESKNIDNPILPRGERRITTVGFKGVRTIVYTVTLTDGVETARSVKSDSVTTAPVTEIVHVGTKVETPKDDEQDARLSALEKFAEAVTALFAKIAEAFANWRKK